MISEQQQLHAEKGLYRWDVCFKMLMEKCGWEGQGELHCAFADQRI